VNIRWLLYADNELARLRRTSGGSNTAVSDTALEAASAIVIYVDLWEDKKADPGEVIIASVKAELAKREGVIKRLAKSSGMDKVSLGGMSFSLDRVGLAKGVSLSAALAALSDETKQLIVMVIDEAQHAITSTAGGDALFALKAARDELNSSRHHGLRIVATGSNRDKLAMLRNSKDQAFFGAPLVPFPELDKSYIEWFVAQLDFGKELDPTAVFEWFKQAAYRPEVLGAAVDALTFDAAIQPGQYAKRLEELVQKEIDASNTEALRVVHSLTPLQSAILRVMAATGVNYAPFEQATMERYRAVLTATAPDAKIEPEAGNVQQALTALQEKTLAWKASRGVYALEDTFLAELMDKAGMLADAKK